MTNTQTCKELLLIFYKAMYDITHNYNKNDVYINSFVINDNSKKIKTISNNILNNDDVLLRDKFFKLAKDACDYELSEYKEDIEKKLNANIYIGYNYQIDKYKLYYYCDKKK